MASQAFTMAMETKEHCFWEGKEWPPVSWHVHGRQRVDTILWAPRRYVWLALNVDVRHNGMANHYLLRRIEGFSFGDIGYAACGAFKAKMSQGDPRSVFCGLGHWMAD